MAETVTRKRPTRPGGEKRGNSRDRRARKLWLLSAAAPFGGDGSLVPCVHCATPLDYGTVEADRVVPGESYRRSNVQPACRSCNLGRSDNVAWSYLSPTAVAV